MIPYTSADYKKYCFAQAVIQDIIDGVDPLDAGAVEDISHVFEHLHDWL